MRLFYTGEAHKSAEEPLPRSTLDPRRTIAYTSPKITDTGTTPPDYKRRNDPTTLEGATIAAETTQRVFNMGLFYPE